MKFDPNRHKTVRGQGSGTRKLFKPFTVEWTIWSLTPYYYVTSIKLLVNLFIHDNDLDRVCTHVHDSLNRCDAREALTVGYQLTSRTVRLLSNNKLQGMA